MKVTSRIPSLSLFSILFFFFLFPVYGSAGTSAARTVDSLLNIMENASARELLKIHPHLHKALYEVGDIDVHLGYNRDFVDLARKAGDKKAEAVAYALKIEALYNYRMPDSVILAEALQAVDFMRDLSGSEVHYFYAGSVVGDIYILQGKYGQALETAQGFYEEAKKKGNSSGMVTSLQTMGKAYEDLGLPDRAEISFREAIAAADERTDTGMKGMTYSDLVDMMLEQGRYEDALETNREFEAFLDRIGAAERELKNLYFLSYLAYAASYTKLGQYDVAWDYIAKAEEFPIGKTDLGIYSIEKERFPLLLAQERFGEAERALDLMETVLEGDVTSSYMPGIKIKEDRAELYHRWGLYDKAAVYYRDYIGQKDSLQRAELAEKLGAMRARYEIDKLELREQEQARLFRNRLIWFMVVLVLLCVITAIVILDVRRVRAKNRSLIARIREQDKMEEDNERLRNQLAMQDTSAGSGVSDEDRLSDLYLKLKELMKDPRVFTDPDINRKTIADRLGTNEKYVFDTVRRYYDMSISAYITNIRLNYARNLLADPSDRRTVETVAAEAGFNSRPTFHRLFKERYGMTPDEFRRLVAGS